MANTLFLSETLNRRARSLAYLRPLFDLQANKGRHPDLALDRFDLFRFASDEPSPAFADDVKIRVEAALDTLPESAYLSDWLAGLDSSDADARHLAVLLAGQWCERLEYDIVVSVEGRQLNQIDAYGDDLVLIRRSNA